MSKEWTSMILMHCQIVDCLWKIWSKCSLNLTPIVFLFLNDAATQVQQFRWNLLKYELIYHGLHHVYRVYLRAICSSNGALVEHRCRHGEAAKLAKTKQYELCLSLWNICMTIAFVFWLSCITTQWWWNLQMLNKKNNNNMDFLLQSANILSIQREKSGIASVWCALAGFSRTIITLQVGFYFDSIAFLILFYYISCASWQWCLETDRVRNWTFFFKYESELIWADCCSWQVERQRREGGINMHVIV